MGIVLHSLCAQDQGVVGSQPDVAAGDDVLTAPADHGHDDAVGELQILDVLVHPAVAPAQVDLDEEDVVLMGVFAHALQA